MLHAFIKIEKFIMKIEVVAIIFILLMMCFLSFGQVIMRNIFSSGFVWGDVIVRIGVLWVAILGASIATTEKGHIHIDLFTRVLPEPYDEYLDASLSLFAAAICGYFLYVAIDYVSIRKEVGSIMEHLNTPEWIFAAIFPIGFFMMALKFVLRFFHDLDIIKHGEHEVVGNTDSGAE